MRLTWYAIANEHNQLYDRQLRMFVPGINPECCIAAGNAARQLMHTLPRSGRYAVVRVSVQFPAPETDPHADSPTSTHER